jgi:hypothetical protein
VHVVRRPSFVRASAIVRCCESQTAFLRPPRIRASPRYDFVSTAQSSRLVANPKRPSCLIAGAGWRSVSPLTGRVQQLRPSPSPSPRGRGDDQFPERFRPLTLSQVRGNDQFPERFRRAFHARACSAESSCANSRSARCTNWTQIDPSPTADATRFTLFDRTSPTANTPGRLVSIR